MRSRRVDEPRVRPRVGGRGVPAARARRRGRTGSRARATGRPARRRRPGRRSRRRAAGPRPPRNGTVAAEHDEAGEVAVAPRAGRRSAVRSRSCSRSPRSGPPESRWSSSSSSVSISMRPILPAAAAVVEERTRPARADERLRRIGAMVGVLEGFATIAVIVAVGWLLADRRILDDRAQVNLSRLAFYVASPALLLTVMQRTSLDAVLSATSSRRSSASPSSSASTCSSPGSVGRRHARVTPHRQPLGGLRQRGQPRHPDRALRPRRRRVGRADAAACSCSSSRRSTWRSSTATRAASARRCGRSLRRMFSNPITLGAVAGLLIAVFDIDLPRVVAAPIDLLGAMAVPSMLVAFGISLRRGPRPATGRIRRARVDDRRPQDPAHAGRSRSASASRSGCAARRSSPSS